MRTLLLAIALLLLNSCHNNKIISKNEIDNFIGKYQSQDFSEFKNVSILIRQTTLTSTIYIISKYQGNLPVYFIVYNELENKITEINNSLLKQQKISDYFTDQEINSLINKFRHYQFCLLGVDSNKDLFINPFYANNPAAILRKSKGSKLEISKLSGNFIHYKDDWYINLSVLPDLKL
jgi:hypothetical protein